MKSIRDRATELLDWIEDIPYIDERTEAIIAALQKERELTKCFCIDTLVNDRENSSHIVAKRDIERKIRNAEDKD